MFPVKTSSVGDEGQLEWTPVMKVQMCRACAPQGAFLPPVLESFELVQFLTRYGAGSGEPQKDSSCRRIRILQLEAPESRKNPGIVVVQGIC